MLLNKKINMLQLLFHLWGDYVTQNHWMASTKVKNTAEGYLSCLVHTILYSAPFLLLTQSYDAMLIIFWSHYWIDKLRLAKYVIQLRDWNFTGKELQPPYLSVWLMIIADNTFHITINYLAIKYF